MRKILAWGLAVCGILSGCLPLRLSNVTRVLAWPAGQHPFAPAGFRVCQFVGGLDSPRNLVVASNGDVFVAGPDRITLLRDANGDGNPELRATFLGGLNQPYGMAVAADQFLVASTDSIFAYPYKPGLLEPSGPGRRILQLPAGDDSLHWKRNLLLDEAHRKLYISVGSASNAGEKGMQQEYRRANILELDLKNGAERVYASGLRDPMGMDWATSGQLWSVVSESERAPDYLTSVQDGGFYGWPYTYSGDHPQNIQLARKAIRPDVNLGYRTAAQGLAFYRGHSFPSHYRDGAFISEQGAPARGNLSGFKVIFVPFQDGLPSGPPEDFLAGFVPDYNRSEVRGSPAAVAVAWDGALLVADEAGNRIWRVSR
jgi:glucose/arabinose dehydrogenase